MTLAACAAMVENGDPDRFAAAMAAPLQARAKLWPLYAFNLELARLPWVSKEPMIAEMRLQWWHDALEDAVAGKIHPHQVLSPLADVITPADLPVLKQMVTARQWDIYTDPFADAAAFDQYLDDTAGGLMWLAARALGAPDTAEPTLRDYAHAAGLANYLRAVPALESRGRIPLLDGRPDAIAALAAAGLARLQRARTHRHVVPLAIRPALLSGWQAAPLLRQVVHAPQIVAADQMGLSEFSRRSRLILQAATGHW